MTALALLATSAYAAPSFTKAFQPDTIGPGSVSTLTYIITNPDPTPVRNLAFTDTLPAALSIAAVPNAGTSCTGASLGAAANGAVISFSNGGLGANSQCTVSVDITSATLGTHTSTSGDLTSDAGNSGPASADLVVDAGRPGFRKSFAPAAINYGARSTLTFTIDNSANNAAANNLGFTDQLPSGMVVADPALASSTCSGGVVSATAGSNSIGYSPQFFGDASVSAGSSCTVSVDIVANAVGSLGNVTGQLTSINPRFQTVSSGKASAALDVTAERINISKAFVDDPVAPGATVELAFTIRNLDRRSTADGIGFTDNLDAVLPGLTTLAPLPTEPCGPGSSLSGGGTISLTAGSLPAEGSCTFSVTLQVPAGTAGGSYTNVTSNVSANLDGASATGDPATDQLVVTAAPILDKRYLDNPVATGATSELQFTLTNASTTAGLTDVSYTDTFAAGGLTVTTLPGANFCGAGSFAGFTSDTLTISGATLPAGGSCTFSVTVQVATDALSGDYPNTTSKVSGLLDGAPVTGNAAFDTLQVVAPPRLRATFVDDPVAPGDPVILRFRLDNLGEASSTATNIAFSDDLSATLAGLSATGLPLNDVCGTGSSISGTDNLSFSGGTLQPGVSCSFDVTLQTPSAAIPGSYANTTSNVVALVAGLSVTGNQASDTLELYGLSITKTFVDDPILAGGTVVLRYRLANNAQSPAAGSLMFTDSLNVVPDGLQVATPLPLDNVCGNGSSLTQAGTNLVLQGGSLASGGECAFDVSLQVPLSTPDDDYISTTSTLFADIDGTTVGIPGATDKLTVTSNLLTFTKQFVNDPVTPGGTVELSFTLTNPTATPVTDLSFSDDLSAVLSGLSSTGGTLNDICGAGSSLSGTDLLTFTGGSLAAGGNCSFSVTLSVPALVQLGTVLTNTTSQLAGLMGGLPVYAAPATDELQVDYLSLSKTFSAPSIPGDTVSLRFTLHNASSSATFNGISFTDDLDSVLPGLSATGTPVSDPCGAGSLLDGGSYLIFSSGSLLPGGSCSFEIDLQIPADALPGDYLNETSEILTDGLHAGAAASATLTVQAETDADHDGVDNDADYCPGTVIPESVPTRYLKYRRYALVDEDYVFDTGSKHRDGKDKAKDNGARKDRKNRKGRRPATAFTTADTDGCSCEQIIAAAGLGNGHVKYGCSIGVMRAWVRDRGFRENDD